jgi:uncharacterized protein (TIGR03437 family)
MSSRAVYFAWRALALVSFRRSWVVLLFASASILGAQRTLTFQTSPITADTGITQVLTGDFNNDGNADIVVLQVSRVTVVLGNGDGTFRPPIHAPVNPTPGLSSMAVGDFNNDGKLDLVVFGTSNVTPFVETYLGQGDGTFAPPVSSPSSAHVADPAIVRDVNRDGFLDLVGPAGVALGAGDGTFPHVLKSSAACSFSSSSSYLGNSTVQISFDAADFRHQGTLDLADFEEIYLRFAGGEAEKDLVTACPGNGDGTFGSGAKPPYTAQYSLGDSFYALRAGDFNGDGNQDIVIIGHYESQSGLFYSSIALFGNGDDTFQQPVVTFSGGAQASSAWLPSPVVADMNGDGKTDLVQPAGLSGVDVLISNGDGTFSSPMQALSARDPYQSWITAAVADFNNDGLPDIVASTGEVTVVSSNTTARIDSVVNAASLDPKETVAPGSLVAIFGAGLGPHPGLARIGTDGPSLVTFNGIPATTLYSSATQINAQVPWEISGDAKVIVTYNGLSGSLKVSTAPIAPGIFNFLTVPIGHAFLGDSVTHLAFAFNSDGTVAGLDEPFIGGSFPNLVPSHPAVAGDTLTVYANGLGPVSPSIADGVPSSDVVRTAGPTPAFIGGIACDVSFAGLSSTQLGVNVLNVVVPAGVHGLVPIQINAGGIITSDTIKIAVQ